MLSAFVQLILSRRQIMTEGENVIVYHQKVVVQTAALFVLASAGSAYAYDVSLKPFTDVTNEDWFQNEVYSLSAIGIIDGYSDLTYKPDGILTREAFIKLLMNAKQEEVASGSAVSGEPVDVEQGVGHIHSYPRLMSGNGLILCWTRRASFTRIKR